MLETAGLNSPVCLKEHAIAQVLQPPQDGILKITIRLLQNDFASFCFERLKQIVIKKLIFTPQLAEFLQIVGDGFKA